MFSITRSLTGISILLFCAAGAYSQETSSHSVKSNSEFRFDRFGQLAACDWPEKVHDEKDLIKDANDDEAYYKSIALPVRDQYGGYMGTKKQFGLNATGFFHIEKIGIRCVLVTPEGNAFFSIGVGGLFPYHDWLPNDKETANIFEWMPQTNGKYKKAFFNENKYFSFYAANWIRKYGSYNTGEWKNIFAQRLKRWGFNTHNAYGGFSSTSNSAKIPMTIVIRVYGGKKRIIPVVDLFDIFDSESCELVEQEISKAVSPYVNEPMIIGYYFHNEPKFYELTNEIIKLNGDWPVKQRLVKWLEEKYKDINSISKAWDMQAKSFDDLLLPLELKSKTAVNDMQKFRIFYMETYFKFMHDTFHKYDSNHLILGYRFRWKDSRDDNVNKAVAPYVDVISDNYYGTGEFDSDFLKRAYKVSQKPRILSEWSYDADDCGLPGYIRHVDTQLTRAKAYRQYQEQAASLPFIVGTQWWCMLDHERWTLNTGLVNVADRPYKLFLKWVREANLNIEKIMFENKTPFSTPKFKAAFRYGRKDFGTNNWRLIQVGQNKETVDVKGGEEE